ncbi:AAA family ATPase [Candidatus Saccharibacteria bacterium]|nr:AAA family ATPase [Candidatus Saccharibacteria bacterium]
MKKVILFAGCPGSGKTPIAYYLSQNLNLPILNNDAIRTEVSEDHGWYLDGKDDAKYYTTRDERAYELLKSGKDFIYDASIDRTWSDKKAILIQSGYEWFIISINLSKDKLKQLYINKKYDKGSEGDWTERLDGWCQDHQKFLEKFSGEIGLCIDDDNFIYRLSMSLEATRRFMKGGR